MKSPLLDGHNDTPWRIRREFNSDLESFDFSQSTADIDPLMKTDIPRLRAGGVGGVFWSVFVPDSWAKDGASKFVREQIALVHRLVDKYPDHLEIALTAQDVRRIHAAGKIASLIGMEGGHSIDGSLEILREFHHSGARYLTIAGAETNALADSATGETVHGGLSPLGKKVAREMNRLGMMVDISHASIGTMQAVLDVSDVPVIFSHSSSRAVCDSPRNVPDDILKIMADKDGVIMITFVNMFLNDDARKHHDILHKEWKRLKSLYPEDEEKAKEEIRKWEKFNPTPPATMEQIADHIDHVRNVAGIDYIGIGSDFAGFRTPPFGLEDVSLFPNLFAELMKRGYSSEDLIKIAGENILRVMNKAANPDSVTI
ncbi:dipeptidase [Candidatus Sumerlaeota bacterium]|nr:dipeptidase [Candidatus Sumerlaeota bacterium]